MSKLLFKQRIIKLLTPIVYPILKAYWKIRKPKTFGTKAVVRNKEGEMLIVRHSYHEGLWTFPGGRLEKGERILDSAKREIKEEVGIETKDAKLVGSFVNTSEGKIDTVYIVSLLSESDEFLLDEFEILEAKWCEENKLPRLSAVGEKILNIYKQKYV